MHWALRSLLLLGFLAGFFAWGQRNAEAITCTVTNTNNAGAGSLRQAIVDNNNSLCAANFIVFNIPGAGPHVITVTTA